jgi:hypothetical protein
MLSCYLKVASNKTHANRSQKSPYLVTCDLKQSFMPRLALILLPIPVPLAQNRLRSVVSFRFTETSQIHIVLGSGNSVRVGASPKHYWRQCCRIGLSLGPKWNHTDANPDSISNCCLLPSQKSNPPVLRIDQRFLLSYLSPTTRSFFPHSV